MRPPPTSRRSRGQFLARGTGRSAARWQPWRGGTHAFIRGRCTEVIRGLSARHPSFGRVSMIGPNGLRAHHLNVAARGRTGARPATCHDCDLDAWVRGGKPRRQNHPCMRNVRVPGSGECPWLLMLISGAQRASAPDLPGLAACRVRSWEGAPRGAPGSGSWSAAGWCGGRSVLGGSGRRGSRTRR